MANNVRIGVGVTGAKGASSELDKLRDKFDKIQKQGAKGFALGVGVGAAAKAFSLLDSAAAGAVQFLGDATQAALEEEASVAKLGAALRANIPDWDGQTDAIERVLSQRMQLGFSDDEQRKSLALLVAATHDTTKALDIQRTAMDLARLKGIDLASASEALIKVEAGSYRILKSLGIVLKDNATQQDALNAVQAVAAGQAEAYANTNAGKLLVSQVKVGEAMEKFGAVTMPLVVAATGGAADAISGLAGTFDVLQGKMPTTAEQARDLQKDIAAFGADLPLVGIAFSTMQLAADDALVGVVQATQDADERIGASATNISDNIGGMNADIDYNLDQTKASFGFASEASSNMADDMKSSTKRAGSYYDKLRQTVIDDTESMIDNAFNPIETKLDAQGDHYEVLADIVTLSEAKGKAAHNDAKRSIIRDLDSEARHLLDLGKDHKLTKHQVETFSTDVRAAYHAIGSKVPPQIQKVIHKLDTLSNFNGDHIKMTVDISQRVGISNKNSGGGKKNAAGYVGTTTGPTMTGVGWMGEAGTEAYAILKNPKVITAGSKVASGASLGGGGGLTQNFNLTVMGDLKADNKDSVVAAMKRLKAVGTNYPIPGVIPHG